jgi:hypothetical protein
MLERNISGSQIELTIERPDNFRPGLTGTTILSRRFADGRTLKVYVVGNFPVDVPTIVVTAVWKG